MSTSVPTPTPHAPGQAPAPDGDASPPPRGPGTFAAAGAVLRKELRVELRTLESVPAMSLFAVTTFVLFHFGLSVGARGVEGDLAAGILWVTLLFSAVLGINRLFVADEEQGGFDAFLLAPVDRTALLLAKAGALGLYLIALEVVALPAFGLLLLGPSLGQALPGLLGVVALGDLGLVAVGTLVAALAVRTRSRDLIGPLLALPLVVPIVLAAARASAPLLRASGAGALPGRWLAILALYDLVFGLIAYAVFDFLLED